MSNEYYSFNSAKSKLPSKDWNWTVGGGRESSAKGDTNELSSYDEDKENRVQFQNALQNRINSQHDLNKQPALQHRHSQQLSMVPTNATLTPLLVVEPTSAHLHMMKIKSALNLDKELGDKSFSSYNSSQTSRVSVADVRKKFEQIRHSVCDLNKAKLTLHQTIDDRFKNVPQDSIELKRQMEEQASKITLKNCIDIQLMRQITKGRGQNVEFDIRKEEQEDLFAMYRLAKLKESSINNLTDKTMKFILDSNLPQEELNHSSLQGSTLDSEMQEIKAMREDDNEMKKIGLTVFNDERFKLFLPEYEAYNIYQCLNSNKKYHESVPEINNHAFRKQIEEVIQPIFSQFTQDQKAGFIASLIPEFGAALDQLQETQTKYEYLTKKLNEWGSLDHEYFQREARTKLREELNKDKFVRQTNLLDDLTPISRRSNSTFTQLTTLLKNKLKEEQFEQRQVETLRTERQMLAFDTEVQLNSTQMKLRDAQINRLQEKLREKIQIENQSKTKIQQIQQQNQHVVQILEKAYCFGKILFAIEPSKGQSLKGITDQLQRAYKQKQKELQAEYNQRVNQKHLNQWWYKTDESQLLKQDEKEILDGIMQEFVQQEFIQLSQTILNCQVFQNSAQFVIAVVTSNQFLLYNDMHMSGDALKEMQYSQCTFYDLGISIQNEQKKEQYEFVKVVRSTDMPMRREVYLMGIPASQKQKWQRCLNLKNDVCELDYFMRSVYENLLLKEKQKPENLSSQIQIGSNYLSTDVLDKRQQMQQMKDIMSQLAESIQYLTNGVIFVKYGRRGVPKKRLVFLNQDRIYWQEPDRLSNPQHSHRNIRLKDILALAEDQEFKFFKKLSFGNSQLQFSIKGKKRDLNLEAQSLVEKQLFMSHLQTMISNLKVAIGQQQSTAKFDQNH